MPPHVHPWLLSIGEHQPIMPQLAEILQRERDMAEDDKGFIFPTERPGLAKAGHRSRMTAPLARVVKAAGLDPKRITPHTMRHTAITNLVRAGVDLQSESARCLEATSSLQPRRSPLRLAQQGRRHRRGRKMNRQLGCRD